MRSPLLLGELGEAIDCPKFDSPRRSFIASVLTSAEVNFVMRWLSFFRLPLFFFRLPLFFFTAELNWEFAELLNGYFEGVLDQVASLKVPRVRSGLFSTLRNSILDGVGFVLAMRFGSGLF